MVSASLPDLFAVALVVCIAAVPLWYPRYSFVERKGAGAIDRLRRDLVADTTTDDADGLAGTATLEAGESGFSALVGAMGAAGRVSGSPARIELIHTDPDPGCETFVVGSAGGAEAERAVLRLVFDDGTSEPVLESEPLGVERVLELGDLRRWLTVHVHARSQYATTVLVVCWATVLLVGNP